MDLIAIIIYVLENGKDLIHKLDSLLTRNTPRKWNKTYLQNKFAFKGGQIINNDLFQRFTRYRILRYSY
jgi:hypothetical protein